MKRSAVLAIFLATPGLMMGAALFGQLSLNGGTGQNVAVGFCTGSSTLQCIDFDWTGTATTGTPSVVQTGTVDGTGDNAKFTITNAFSTNNGGTSTIVTVHDLENDLEPVGGPGSSNLTNFLTFNVDPWTVTLTQVQAGTDGLSQCGLGLAAGSQNCTPGANSSFNEQNSCPVGVTSATQCTVTVSITMDGTANDGSGNTSGMVGVFQTTFAGTIFQLINADILAGEDVETSDSGTFNFTPTSGVPEPATLSLIGAGLLGLGLARRARRRL